MSTTFVPEVVEASVETVVRKAKTIANLPPIGTRIRATLDHSVLIGTIRDKETQGGQIVHLVVDGVGFAGFREYALWLASGWAFEILDAAEVAA
jgi:hypothetical protein